jgi:branched-chain amino acid transport system permease protein
VKALPVLSRARLLAWGGCLALLVVAPLVWQRGYFLSLLSQIGIMTILALSYNMLLGQTGLLSFGHAVYYGLGAFGTLHVLNLVHRWGTPFCVTLLPLSGGMVGLLFALVFGWVMTRRAGTTFAMISLGIGEMAAAGSLMFPAFFGGEGGVSGNRVTGKPFLGVTYASPLQMYYLIAAWAFVCSLAIYALTQTPLGRMANAVRDNPERAQFVGYDPQWVRFLMLMLAGFFAGIAGGLTALNYEIVTAEVLSDHISGLVIFMAYVGGIGVFAGPALGAALITVLQITVAGISRAWPLYFGLCFLGIVLYAPGGIGKVLLVHQKAWRARLIGRLVPAYLRVGPPLLLFLLGVVAIVEMAYAVRTPGAEELRVGGLVVRTSTAGPWLAALLAAALGLFLLRHVWHSIRDAWAEVDGALHSLEPSAAPSEEGRGNH